MTVGHPTEGDVKLDWNGVETVGAAIAAVVRHRPIELQLPANYHHALLVRAQPAAAKSALPEILDITGGPELLAEIAHIDGLKELAALIPAVLEAKSRVRILSPSPKVTIVPPDDVDG